MERLKVTGLASAYGKKQVLTDVSVAVRAGECVGIVGANGCGKSTFLAILAGLLRADGGQIYLDGTCVFAREPGRKVNVLKKDMFRRCIGYVPQECSLVEELSVLDNLKLWYKDAAQLETELEYGLSGCMGIKEFCRVKVGKLSGGMKKKVSIACALGGAPPILLLDEPEAALDLPGREELNRYLRTYVGQGGTVLLATHEESALDICDRIYALSGGMSREINRSLRGEALARALR